MSILVFGKTGQLARELAIYDDVTCLGRDEADLTDPAACTAAIKAYAPAVVINAAAYTAVDEAEEEEALATEINGQGLRRSGHSLFTVSTDYVFDGSGAAPWQAGDAVAPVNAYGRSKLVGEEATLAAGGTHAILRCSWVVSAHGSNFVKTMLRLGAEREALTIIADQIGAPTPARDLARACLEMAWQLQQDPGKSGTYHLQGTPEVSWAGFAREIFTQANVACAVTDIPTTDYPTPAARPLNSRLDCSALETVFGIFQPDWRQGLSEILKDLGELT